MIHHRQLHAHCACPVQAFQLLPRLMCVSTSRLSNPALLLRLRRCLKLTGGPTSGWEPDSGAPAQAVAGWSKLNAVAHEDQHPMQVCLLGRSSLLGKRAESRKHSRCLIHIWAQLVEQRWHLQGQMIRLLPVVFSARCLNTWGMAPEPLQFAMLQENQSHWQSLIDHVVGRANWHPVGLITPKLQWDGSLGH